MDETLHNLWNTLVRTGLRVLACAAILIVGWLICRIVARAIRRLLDRTRLNSLAERHGLRKWSGRYTPAELIAKIIYYALVLFVFQLAFSVFGDNPVSDIIDTVIAWIPRVVVALIILAVSLAIADAAATFISNAFSEVSYGRLLGRIAQVAIIAIGVIAALSQVGIALAVTMPVLITVLAVIGGILIVGVGGGLIQPMRQRWERILDRAEAETAAIGHSRRGDPTGTERGDTPPAASATNDPTA